MKNSEIAIWIGALAGVALVVLYLMQDTGGESGGSVNPTFQVTGITPDVAAIYSSERVAKLTAKKDVMLGWLAQTLGVKQADNALTLGLDQSKNALALGLDQSKTALQLGTLVSNNEVRSTEVSSAAQTEVSRVQALANVQAEQIKADAAKYTAKKQASGKTIGAIGGIISGIASFF